MAESGKINNIEQMYSFITDRIKQDDWLQYIDEKYGNKDGTVVKSEFSYFVKKEMTEEDFKALDYQTNFSDSNQNDLINKFWASIDTNRNATQHISGTKLYDQNALNNNEEEEATFNLERHRAVLEVVDWAYKEFFERSTNLSQKITGSRVGDWRTSLRQSLTDTMVNTLKRGTDYTTIEQLKNLLKTDYAEIAAKKITADMVAQDYLKRAKNTLVTELGQNYKDTAGLIPSDIKKQLESEVERLLFANDKTDISSIQAIINNYIARLNTKVITDSVDEVATNIEILLKEYLGLAFPDHVDGATHNDKNVCKGTDFVDPIPSEGEENTTQLYRIGYDPMGEEGTKSINDIQTVVLRPKLQNQIDLELSAADKIKGDGQAPYYTQCKALYSQVINPFVDKYLTTITQGKYKDYYYETNSRDYVDNLINSTEFQAVVEFVKSKAALVKSSVDAVFGGMAIPDIAESVYNSIENKSYSVTPTFYVTNDGDVKFVIYDTMHGVFNDEPNEDLNNTFADLKEKLEEGFKGYLIGRDQELKDNLFQAALFLTLSDTNTVRSQYNSINIGNLLQAVIENYSTIVEKLYTDDTDSTANYLENYRSSSILAGRNPAPQQYDGGSFDPARNSAVNGGPYSSSAKDDVNLYLTRPDGSNYYNDDSTGDGDDWVYLLNSRVDDSATYKILHIHSSESINDDSHDNAIKDDATINAGMDKLFEDYLAIYGDVVGKDIVLDLFKNAQYQTWSKFNSLTSVSSPAGTSIYGYGECVPHTGKDPNDNYDTIKSIEGGKRLVNAGSVILNIMYEFEALLYKQLLLSPSETDSSGSKETPISSASAAISEMLAAEFGQSVADAVMEEANKTENKNATLESIKDTVVGTLIMKMLNSASSMGVQITTSTLDTNALAQPDIDLFLTKSNDDAYVFNSNNIVKCFGEDANISTINDLISAIETKGFTKEYITKVYRFSEEDIDKFFVQKDDTRYYLDHEAIQNEFDGNDVLTPGQLMELIELNSERDVDDESDSVVVPEHETISIATTRTVVSGQNNISYQELNEMALDECYNLFTVKMADIFADRGGLPEGMSNAELEAFYTVATQSQDSEKIRKSAILYLQAIFARDDNYLKQKIADEFTYNVDNYESIINGTSEDDIKTLEKNMEKLINLVNNIDKNYYENDAIPDWNVQNGGSAVLNTNGSTILNINRATIKDRNGKDIDNTKITYVLGDATGPYSNNIVSTDYGSISLSSSKISMQATKIPGTVTAYLYAKVNVDGTEVLLKSGAKAITFKNHLDVSQYNQEYSGYKITTLDKGDDNWAGRDSGNSTIVTRKLNGTTNGYFDLGYYDALWDDINLEKNATDLANAITEFNKLKGWAQTEIGKIIDSIGDAMRNSGVNQGHLQDALDKTKEYYEDIIANMWDNTKDDDEKNDAYAYGLKTLANYYQYTGENGDAQAGKDARVQIENGNCNNNSGLVLWENDVNKSSYGISVSAYALIHKFQEIYNTLVDENA